MHFIYGMFVLRELETRDMKFLLIGIGDM